MCDKQPSLVLLYVPLVQCGCSVNGFNITTENTKIISFVSYQCFERVNIIVLVR